MKPQLVEISLESLDHIIDTAWSIYQDPLTKYYPVIDDRLEVERIYKEAFMYNQLLVFDYRGTQGYFPYILDEDNTFIQANGGLACTQYYDHFMEAIIDHLSTHYQGTTFMVGYPSTNTAAQHYHQNNHEDDLVEVMFRTEIVLDEKPYLDEEGTYGRLLTHQEAEFIQLHTHFEPNAYWDAESILDHDDRWVITSNQDGPLSSIAGAITYDKQHIAYAEIFFAHAHSDASQGLLKALMAQLYELDVRHILCLVDRDHEHLQTALKAVGFNTVDDYYCYSRTL